MAGSCCSCTVFTLAVVQFLSQAEASTNGAIVFPYITGRPGVQLFAPHPGWIDLFPAGDTAGVGAEITADGRFTLPQPVGRVSLIAGFERMETAPLIASNWFPTPGGLSARDIALAQHFDYVCMPPGYPDRWAQEYIVRAHAFCQTFVAKSQWLYSVTVFDATKIVWWGNKVFVSIHEGGPDGPVLAMRGPADGITEFQTAQHTDFEFPRVGFRHGDIPLVPGRKYGLKVRGYESHGGQYFDLDAFVRPDHGDGYGPGRVYADRKALEGDLCLFAMGNATGQIIETQIRSEEWEILIPRHPPTTRWGQTFVSHGRSMAGVQLWGSNGSDASVTCTVRVRQESPDGPPVGPSKTATGRPISRRPVIRYPDIPGQLAGCEAFYRPPFDQFSASFVPDEAPLEPGRTYYVELLFSSPVMLFADGDFYHDGFAYYDGQKIEQDTMFHSARWTLAMSIVTYENPGGVPSIYERPTPTPEPGGNLLSNPGAETGDFAGWIIGGDPTIDPQTDVPNPPNHSGSHRFGISVGWGTADFYQYQEVTVVPGATYETGMWAAKMDGTDETLTMGWVDGPFGGPEEVLYSMPASATSTVWVQFNGKIVRPTQDRVAVVLRYRHPQPSNIASVHVDDIVFAGPGPMEPAVQGK